MSSFDKTVKLACKPKQAPPKAKYLDPIISATYSEDGAIHDVCKALSARFREPNAIVVFKALIVLHTMMRNGATDNVLTYLSTDDILKLRNVSTGQWEGYHAPRNLHTYAAYLDSRIRVFKELKHDPVRVQADSNRDQRVESSLDQTRGPGGALTPQRSKTIAGRKLRAMTVEKGLLRETKAVQRTVTALLECRFYLDDLEDELIVTALRMLVKDLLVLSQALNEGVVNVLEHYFEMSRVDAESALNIYRNFCKQNDRIVEYLGVAKKLQNLLNIPIPNFKHAPVSLASALEEYLNDPNFENNRLEYKANKALVDKPQSNGASSTSKSSIKPPSNQSSSAQASSSTSSQSNDNAPSKPSSQALVDFFASIEEETPLANMQRNGAIPAQVIQQQPTAVNPFAQRQSMMFTGAFPQQQLFAQPQLSQQTGFIQPQPTAFPAAFAQAPGPALAPLPTQASNPPFHSFLQSQPTGFVQSHATGPNPFRQSMMVPQMTGMPAFGSSPFQGLGPVSSSPSPASAQAQPMPGQNAFGQPNGSASPFAGPSTQTQNQANGVPQRPSSTPITSITSSSFGQVMNPVVSHQTGSRNPFGVPQQTAPPVPKPPTLQEIAFGAQGGGGANFTQPQQTTSTAPTVTTPSTSAAQSTLQPKPFDSTMANVASSFSFNNKFSVDLNKPGESPSQNTPSLLSQPTATSTTASAAPSTFSSQFTGSTTATTTSSLPMSPLQSQTTGFSGIKPFKPTSSFGASLLESLPPIPQSSPSTPAATANVNSPSLLSHVTGGGGFGSFAPSTASTSTPTTSTAASSTPMFGALNAQATGFSGFGSTSANTTSNLGLGGGLRPQMTGSGPNPFRASMFGGPAFGSALGSTATGAFPGGNNGLGSSLFSSNLAGSSQNPSLDPSKSLQTQQNGVASLI